MPLFLSYEDTRRMLDHAIVSYEGSLVYVHQVLQNQKAHVVDLETGERFVIATDFEKIGNPKDGRLGYVNTKGMHATYLVRFSARVYKMGYSSDNVVSLLNGQQRRAGIGYLGAQLEGIHNAYVNKYPSFQEAFEMSKDLNRMVAYDRSFAVASDQTIHYQSHRVGRALDGNEDNIVWTPKGLLAQFVRQRPKLNWRE